LEVKILGNVEEGEGEGDGEGKEAWARTAKLKSLCRDFGLIMVINKINEYII